MMRVWLLALLLATPAYAQSDVKVIGTVTPGNCVKWFSQTQIEDPGVTCNGGAGSSPGGSNGQVQFNNSGTFGGLTNAQLTALLSGSTQNDVFFGSGRPWCDPRANGAVGDGSTDDDTAFVACLTTLSALAPVGGGEIRNSPGHYCLQSGAFSAALAASSVAISLTGPGRLVTSMQGVAWLDVCGADVDLIHFNAGAGSSVRGLRITGAPFTTNPAHNALTITNGSAIAESLIEGGYHAVTTAAGVADWTLIDNNIRNSYGPAVIEAGSAGGYLIRNKVDGANTANTAPTAWAANASVTAGQSVTTLGPNGVSYIIHYTVSGTSGGTAPVIAKYGTTFTDGTASAQLAVPVGAYALEVNSTLVIADQDDFSGNYAYGVHVTGASANFVSVSDDMSANLSGSILIDNGYANILSGLLGGCVASPCKVINVTSSAAGVTVGSGTSVAGATTGIEYDTGAVLQVTGARFSGLTNGINVGTANLSNISIVGNNFGIPSFAVTNAIVFQNGTSDYVSILGNTYQNTTTPFTGTITGSHNRNETLAVSCTLTTVSHLTVVNGVVTLCN